MSFAWTITINASLEWISSSLCLASFRFHSGSIRNRWSSCERDFLNLHISENKSSWRHWQIEFLFETNNFDRYCLTSSPAEKLRRKFSLRCARDRRTKQAKQARRMSMCLSVSAEHSSLNRCFVRCLLRIKLVDWGLSTVNWTSLWNRRTRLDLFGKTHSFNENHRRETNNTLDERGNESFSCVARENWEENDLSDEETIEDRHRM